MKSIELSRRDFLAGATSVALVGSAFSDALGAERAAKVIPVSQRFVTLKPSPFADAMQANRGYVRSLEPERLLHNFYLSAGLPAKGPAYGGWEKMSIAGHSLGHWLSACSLLIANSGDRALVENLDRALSEMARIQSAHRDGYLGGTTVTREGKTVDGKVVFEEVRKGEIRTQGFDVNGGWAPIYAYHKVLAGLIDAHTLAANKRAMPILIGAADYLATIVEGLSDTQLQQLLHAEHGGISEAYADVHVLTGDSRWLRVAERLWHKAVMEPLAEQRDELAGLHANTQIPKVIGAARLYELTGNLRYAVAAKFFFERVTRYHSYVIGGNSEREHFGPPGQLSGTLSTATCEACNSYNMLKLARHLYSREPKAEFFDSYERTQLNHILAHQRPDTGMFAYFMPLLSGASRTFSEPENSFWCCVGTGMESHAKHADSIYWQDATTLYVNLYIPSTLDLRTEGLKIELDSRFPADGEVTLTIARAPRSHTSLALRLPGWTTNPKIQVNGASFKADHRNGYAVLHRRWLAGDRISLSLPMEIRMEPLLGDPQTLAFLSGPLVLAADLGPAGDRVEKAAPALIAPNGATAALRKPNDSSHAFRMTTALGEKLELKPFYAMYDRRTAVYFRTFSAQSWAAERDNYLAAEAARVDLVRRTVDTLYLGEMQPERDHAFESTGSTPGQFYGRSSRRVFEGQSMQFRMKRRPGPAVLSVMYWGEDIDREVAIEIDGRQIAIEERRPPGEREWITKQYSLPPTTRSSSLVRFISRRGDAVIYEIRVITPRASSEV